MCIEFGEYRASNHGMQVKPTLTNPKAVKKFLDSVSDEEDREKLAECFKSHKKKRTRRNDVD